MGVGLLSIIRAPFRVRLTAVQTGVDPRTHYWFKAGQDDYRRLCDGTPWARRRPSADSSHGVCWRCRGMRYDDRERGLRAFSLTHRQTGVFAYDPMDTCDKEEETMRPVWLWTFAKFYASDDREKFMRERARRRESAQNRPRPDDKRGGGRPHGSLLSHMEKHHWWTNDHDIRQLEDNVLSMDVTKQGNAVRQRTYQGYLDQYVTKWKKEQASYFGVHALVVDVGGLRVRVDPEVGMRSGGDRGAFPRVLKLWLDAPEPTDKEIDAGLYLLMEWLSYSEQPRVAQVGVWDVPRAVIKGWVPPQIWRPRCERLARNSCYSKAHNGRVSLETRRSRRIACPFRTPSVIC